MTTLQIIWLTGQAVLFVAWIVLAFRWLIAIRAEAVARSGRSLPGLRPTLAAFRWGLQAPGLVQQRLWLALLTLALLLASLSFGLLV